MNLEAAWRRRHRATRLERARSAQSNENQLTERTRAGPWKLQPRLSSLYSHQARRSDDDESPSAQHKASQQYVVFCFYAIGGPKKKQKNHFKCLIHGRTFSKETKSEVWFGMHAFPVPFPLPSSPRLSCAHLSTRPSGRRTT